MTDPLPADDDELVADLRRLAQRHDPVPTAVLTAARGALALRTLDEELADLLFDSLLDDDLVGVRGSSRRLLTFGTDNLRIEVDIDDEGIVGQITPADASPIIELETPRTATPADVDDLGRFFLTRPETAPFRLRVHGDGRRVVTEWVTL